MMSSRRATPPLKSFLRDEDVAFLHYLENIPRNRQITLVDVGCGTGRTIRYVLKHFQSGEFWSVIGIDYSENMILKAQEKLKEEFKSDDIHRLVHWVRGDANDLPELLKWKSFWVTPFNTSYRVVSCLLNTLGIFPQATSTRLVNKMCNVAGKKGAVFLSFFNADAFVQEAQKLYEALPNFLGKVEGTPDYHTSNTTFTKGTYISHWPSEDEVMEIVKNGRRGTPLEDGILESIPLRPLGFAVTLSSRSWGVS